MENKSAQNGSVKKRTRVRALALSLFEVGETVIIALVAVLIIRSFIAKPFLVSGSSMEPSFYNGDYLLIDEFSYRFSEPERGDIIVFKYPGNPKTFYIKRIIGLPGEEVVINKGIVAVVKDKVRTQIKEDYVTPAWTFGNSRTKLNESEYFVMGDNRNFSYDSRSWGAVPEKNIIGIVRLRLWPVNKVMAFFTPSYEK